MAFDIDNFNNITSGAAGTLRFWSYVTTDASATVLAADYFLDVTGGLTAGDMLYYKASDGSGWLEIATASSTTVTVSANGSQRTSITMTAAEWLGMYAAPKLLLAAPGANKLIRVDNVVYEVNYGAAQFANGGVVAPQYTAVVNGGGTLCTGTIAAATVQGWAADNISTEVAVEVSATAANTVNQGIYLSNATAAFTAGDSIVTVHLDYRILSLSL